MSALMVRNLPTSTHSALRVRAAIHGRSTEAEVRAILEAAVKPEHRVLIGSELASFGQSVGGFDLDLTRDPAPTEAALFD